MALDKNTLWRQICEIVEAGDDKSIKASKPTQDLQKNLMQTYTDVYNENPTIQDGDKTFSFQDRMNQVGQHIGVNNPGQQQLTRTEESDKEFVMNFIDQMLQAAAELRKYVRTNGGVDVRLMYAHNTDQYGKPGAIQPYSDVDASWLMKMKDVIDLLSLNFLYYDPNQKGEDGKPLDLYQTSYMKNTPKSYRNIALGALKQKKEETDPNSLLDYSSLKDYIVNYLVGDETIMKKQLDGTLWHSKSGTGYKDVYSGYDGKDAKQRFYRDHKDMVQSDYFKRMADKLMVNVYGLELNIPESTFTYGNNKLANDTLVINFTSAHRCPAWSDCLVKNACYAKASEHGYKDLFAKNKKVNMMWEGSKYDQRIMDALKAVIRSYLINYEQVATVMNMPAKQKQAARVANAQQVMQQASPDNEYSMINETASYTDDPAQMRVFDMVKSHEGFNQLSDEQAEAIRTGENMLKAKYIRLNEEGDFIGQWLVDAIDEFAGELKRIGVSVAAYTCRNLNYNGIKNIILNASKAEIGTNSDGSIAGAIARRFYAVPEDFYNSLDETYAPSSAAVKYDEEGNPLTEPVMPTLVDEGGERHIIPYPQPVYKDVAGTERNEGYYYYKCPCGRGKKAKKSDVNTPITQRFQNVNLGGASADKSGINCYDCRMCYEPKSELTDKPIVVYVQVHSTEKELFNYKQQKDTGYSKGYQQTRQSLGLNEEVEGQEGEDREAMAFNQIANNAAWSVNQHLQSLSSGQLEESKVKDEFTMILERINNVKF